MVRRVIAGISAAMLAIVAPSASLSGNTTANRVLGQEDFTHNGANIANAQGLNAPAAVAIDKSVTPNRIYVADSANNRVLGWSNAASFINGQPADLEIGQPDFLSVACLRKAGPQTLCHPTGVAVDSAGNLYVADKGNNRVLEYNAPYEHMVVAGVGYNAANLIFGQSNFTSTDCSTPPSPTTLCAPSSVALDPKNNLYISDSRNNRVLEYNTPLSVSSTAGSGDTVADMVFGQTGMGAGECNLGTGTISASSLCSPMGVALDGEGNLYIADTQNSRILEYGRPQETGNSAADKVFGQTGFRSGVCDAQGTAARPGPNSLCSPHGIALDRAGNLYVADTGNRRVLEYNTPLTVSSTAGSGDKTADLVFGQNNSFNTPLCNLTGTLPSAKSLCSPEGVDTDSAGNLFVADTSNGRVLEYYTPLTITSKPGSGDTTADAVLGKVDFVHGGANITTARGLYGPLSVAVDTTATPNHIYVADSLNNRVLGWRDASLLSNGAAADLVFGQPDFTSSAINRGGRVSALSLNYPEGLKVDAAGNLWIADTNNSRILEFNTPYVKSSTAGSGDTVPDLVLGQSNDTTGGCNGPITNVTQPPPNNSFCQAVDVAVDAAGNVYGSDANNNRVLEWNQPLRRGNTTPHMVLGQPDFTSGRCNTAGKGSSPSATTLCTPEGVAVDTVGNLYLTDHLNNRLLEFNNPVSSGSTVPNMVFGQVNYTSSSPGAGPNELNGPRAGVIDSAGNLYISDTFNHRLLEINRALASGNKTANLVFGQNGNFNSAACDLDTGAPTASNLCRPSGESIDSSGNLYVADTANNRVLVFNHPLN
jgi:sugar lactone lactonase YvrE